MPINKEFLTGIKHSAIYYLIAIIITVVFEYLLGWGVTAHAPPLWLFVFSIFLIIGVVIFLFSLLIWLTKKNKYYLGVILSQLIVYIIVIAIVGAILQWG
jgi:FtsH-binding integral membrane protein